MDKAKDSGLAIAAGERSLAEQIDCIKNTGSHATMSLLRTRVLKEQGVPKPKPQAGNAIIFGCYRPFSYPHIIPEFVRLLEMLNVDYTYLKDEVCCGMPVVLQSSGTEQKKHIEGGRELLRTNSERACLKGTKNLAYCCIGCFFMSKLLPSGGTSRHMYILDLILDHLGDTPLRLKPMTIGYFEGCYRRYKGFPGIRSELDKYRSLLDRIAGLQVVDLPNSICCLKVPERIIEIATGQKLGVIVSPCNGCFHNLSVAAKDKIQIRYYAGLIQEALRYSRGS